MTGRRQIFKKNPQGGSFDLDFLIAELLE